ncbi:NAD(P)H-flavin reductase [Glaciecola sp. XM2]|uniref:NAD(P)H-flavin reductase n=1 Tax=Glaciecola sp. XM2 TaxID=1914931 RepID=UPI001BDDD710|nr:NAD(P)H-flavin reductase [Glaciecola sp. XM2]MBT1452248.1 NAD(P)H-flavin reductase [Glaciecola sp. XM2]
MIVTQAQLLSKEQLTPYVYKVLLQPDTAVSFKAGQYLQVVMGAQDKRPFSIANPPYQSDVIELHIGATPANPYAYEVMQKLEQDNALTLEIAHGTAYLQESSLDAILIAGGTGYSYTKSILLDILKNQPNRKVCLYWGGKKVTDLYETPQLQALADAHSTFSYIPVVEHPDDSWAGKRGIVHNAVMQDVKEFSNKQVYVAGRFEMAKVIKDDLLPLGLLPENMLGDAFAFI